MDDRIKRRICNEFSRLCNRVSTREMRAYRYGISLDNESYDSYRKIVKDLLTEEDYQKKFSEIFLEKKISEKMKEAIDSSNNKKKIDELIEELDSFCEKNTVYVPVFGLVLDDFPNGLEIGNVHLENQSVQKILDSLKYNPDLTLIKFVPNSSDDCKVCAKVSFVAEPERAKERAKEEAERVIDLLRLAIAIKKLQESPNFRRKIGTENPFRIRLPLICIDQKGGFVVTPRSGFDSYKISPSEIDHLREMGLMDFDEILRKSSDEITAFEEKMLSALHWFSTSVEQEDEEGRFLNLVIALETILTDRNRESSIRTVLAERVSFIIGDNCERRKNIIKKIKEFYDKRSDISHAGKKAVWKTEVDELEYYVILVILNLLKIKDKFKTPKELFDFFEEARLKVDLGF